MPKIWKKCIDKHFLELKHLDYYNTKCICWIYIYIYNKWLKYNVGILTKHPCQFILYLEVTIQCGSRIACSIQWYIRVAIREEIVV